MKVLAARRKRDLELEEIERLHKPRTRGRLREATEELLASNVSQALQGRNKQVEQIIVGHRRESERLEREKTRGEADVDMDINSNNTQLLAEKDTLALLKKQKQRMEESKSPQPTEAVERQIVDSERHILQLEAQRNKLKEHKTRMNTDIERERAEELTDYQRRLREAR